MKFLTTQRLMAAILFILLFAMAVRIPVDTDTWWHLRSGEYILQNRLIPLTDPFSLTRYQQPWIDHSWGSQLVLYGFHRLLGGNIGLALYTALLATLGMYFVYLMCEGNVYLRAFVIILATATAAVFWSARPQMMSFMLSTVVLYILHLYKRRKIDRLWLIPILMIVWVNLHAGFFIGFLLLGEMIAGEFLGRVFDSANPEVLSWAQLRKLVIITVIAYLVLILNPNTTQMWTYSFRTVSIGILQQYIQEWSSPNFHGRETWPFILLLVGTFASVGLSSKRLDWSDVALFGGFTFLSLYASRNIATFAVVAAPIMSRHADAWLKDKRLFVARARPQRGIGLAINWILLVLVIVGALGKISFTLNPQAVAKAQADLLPVDAAAYLNDVKPEGELFNTYNWGGYLMYAAPQYRIFVDGRTDLYDDAILTKWRDTMIGVNWQKAFEEYNIRLVVIEGNTPLATALRQDAQWKETYTDDKAAIFERQAIQ